MNHRHEMLASPWHAGKPAGTALGGYISSSRVARRSSSRTTSIRPGGQRSPAAIVMHALAPIRGDHFLDSGGRYQPRSLPSSVPTRQAGRPRWVARRQPGKLQAVRSHTPRSGFARSNAYAARPAGEVAQRSRSGLEPPIPCTCITQPTAAAITAIAAAVATWRRIGRALHRMNCGRRGRTQSLTVRIERDENG